MNHHYHDDNPMGVNGYCPTSGFPENGYDEPDEEPPYRTEFDERVAALSEADLAHRAATETAADRLARREERLAKKWEADNPWHSLPADTVDGV